MRKIPTIFKREFGGHKVVKILPEVTKGFEYVLKYGIATIKWDGACCAVINGKFYKRYDAKNGKPVPEEAIKCQEEADPVTGHFPCWVPIDENDPADKWFIEACRNLEMCRIREYTTNDGGLIDCTYEAVGKHFNRNPYNMDHDILIPHGVNYIKVGRSFEEIQNYLKQNKIEGIVFWIFGHPAAKIKRSDFGFEWNKK